MALPNALLTHSGLRRTNLTNANLTGAYLKGANLTDARLSAATLAEAPDELDSDSWAFRASQQRAGADAHSCP